MSANTECWIRGRSGKDEFRKPVRKKYGEAHASCDAALNELIKEPFRRWPEPAAEQHIEPPTTEQLERILALRLRSDEHADLDGEGLGRWMDYELAALEAGMDPDAALSELEDLAACGTKPVEKGRAA
jgi:hypothetical protein